MTARHSKIDAIPPAAPLPRALARHCTTPFSEVHVAANRAIVLQRPELGAATLVIIAGRKTRTYRRPVVDACLRRDGSAAYALVGRRDVMRVEIDRNTSSRLCTAGSDVDEIALVNERYVLCGGMYGSVGFDLEAAERGAILQLAATASWHGRRACGSILDGTVAWLRTRRATLFVTVADGKLVRLARIPQELAIVERDGLVFGSTLDERWVRIEGLGVPAAKPAKPKREPIALERVTEPLPFPKPGPAWAKRARCDLAWWRVAPTGEFVGYDGGRAEIVWFDRDGKRRTFTPATMVRNFDRDATGRVVVADGTTVTLFDDRGVQIREHALGSSSEHLMGVTFGTDDRLVALSDANLVLVDARGRVVHRVPIRNGRSVQAMHGGRYVVTSSWGTYRIEVFEVAGRFVRRFRDRLAWIQSYSLGDRYFVQAESGAWFELAGGTLRA